MEKYLGGGQTPLIRGLLRSIIVRQKCSGYVEYQFNDTDSAGVVPGETIGSEIVSKKSKRDWLPVQWEYPFSHPYEEKTHMLRIQAENPVVIGGLRLENWNLREVVRAETVREIAWIDSLISAPEVAATLGSERKKESEERIAHLVATAEYLITQKRTIGDFWMALGTAVLGDLLSEITPVSFAHGYWTLSRDTADDQKFFLLNACLKDTERFMKIFFESKNIESDDTSRLPFFVVRERDGYLMRDEISIHPNRMMVGPTVIAGVTKPQSAQELAQVFSDNGIQASVVPKILPLIAQLRMLGIIYLTDPPYLAQAEKLAKALGIPQHDIMAVRCDMAEVLDRPLWRALVRQWKESIRSTTWSASATSKQMQYWQKHPTLLLLWILGGNELIKKTAETAKLSFVR